MRVAGDYQANGYTLIEQLVPAEVGRAFLRQLKADIEGSGHSLERLVQPSPLLNRPSVELYGYHYRPMLMFLWALTPTMCQLTGRDLLPSYDYLRIYRRGDICRVHTDRPSCEYSLSLTLDYSDGLSWPLEIGTERLREPEHKARETFRGSASVALPMEPGDAILYEGVFHRHGRTVANPNLWSAHLFLHWVERGGPFAEFAFDGRPEFVEPVTLAFA
ncbi:MAG TPA: hypothetical protein VKI45_09900 [Allosphingosinicella sp.]|nr:hypothetical protein [Allosphingosinicella sp.]